jgi:feruloyl esterase
MKLHAGALCALLFIAQLSLEAHAFPPFTDAAGSAIDYTKTPARPAMACGALVGLADYEFSIISATDVAAGGGQPAHCRVEGVIRPAIRFWLNLPAAWNERFYMSGNGGFAGQQPEGGLPWFVVPFNAALAHGFAAVVTDTGHDERVQPLGTFALNDLGAEIDYAFRAVHLTAVTAKRLTEIYYGKAPRYSYFDGCSTGGRQALIEAQRFPGDFNGIVAGAPVLDFTGTMMLYSRMVRALEAAPVSAAQLRAAAGAIYARCDGRDGLGDGLIDDPRRCDFDPRRDLPRCKAGATDEDCLTEAQLDAVSTVYGDVVIDGRKRFPGLPVGSEIEGPDDQGGQASGWVPWLIPAEKGMFAGTTIGRAFADTFFKYMAFEQDDPAFELSASDLARDAPRMARIERILNATDPDLAEFRARGGKLVMHFGWADAGLNPLMGVEYYERAERANDNAREFFRLFMVPGMFHCRGGVGPNHFDPVTAVINWVEGGAAPERIVATKRGPDGAAVMTRPLCPYPQVARHRGSGSTEEAANFDCVTPR